MDYHVGIFIIGVIAGSLFHWLVNNDMIKSAQRSYDFYQQKAKSCSDCPECGNFLENMKNTSYWCDKCEKLYYLESK